MSELPDSVLIDLSQALTSAIRGEVCFDKTTRILYSTDASIYQMMPVGVAFPKSGDELSACVEIAAGFNVPVLARGAGTSLGGQAVGPALILDCSRYLCRQIDINLEDRTAEVEPGVILNALNRAAAAYGLQFGPDPASAERATVAGSLANNATGARSIRYGMAADHLLSVEVVLSDGSLATFEQISLAAANLRAGNRELVGAGVGCPDNRSGCLREVDIYRAALQIRQDYAGAIKKGWPKTWRRASGYNLNYLLPWSPSRPPQWAVEQVRNGSGGGSTDSLLPYPPVPEGYLNLAPLLAGSEGTLAVIRRAKIRLVPRPRHTILGVIQYSDLASACEAVPQLLELNPSAVELIPESLIRLARAVPVYAKMLTCLDPICREGIPAAMLVVEFSGDNPAALREQARHLGPEVLIAETASEQKQVWDVRKVGLGILMSRAGDLKPQPFIEDLAVPLEQLARFVREMEALFRNYGTEGDFYAHVSAGCIHIRPLLDLKSPKGIASLRGIASEAVQLTLRLGGVPSGEHGDGLARSEWMEQTFGTEVMEAFHLLKSAADPQGLLNPGKILDAPVMDSNLRFGLDYKTKPWSPFLDFSIQAGLSGAVEQCNGAGVCRKAEGVMCPSFQVTKDEMHSTRGRANLLRALITGGFPSDDEGEDVVYEALRLCLACKGCKAECPSAVDMAKLKYEFLERYYRPGSGKRHPLRDYLFAFIGLLGRFGHPFAFIINPVLRQSLFASASDRLLGISRLRKFPQLHSRRLQALSGRTVPSQFPGRAASSEEVIFLSDPFTEYFYPEVNAGQAALRALALAGCQVHCLPVVGSGRTMISKGFLRSARKQAFRVVEAIHQLDPEGKMAVVGVEPSEIYTLRDEYQDLLPGERRVGEIARRAYMIDEFLVRRGPAQEERIMRIATMVNKDRKERGRILLHGHCYQKAQLPAADGFPTGVAATVAMLEAVGYQVSVIEAGCCGMAGAFGYERDHYDLSMKIGENGLFPAVRNAGERVIISAAGISCQAQIESGTAKLPVHPITLVLKD